MTRVDPGMGEVVVEPVLETTVDGKLRSGANIAVGPEIVEQYRTGYRCLACHTVQDEPFPEVCKERWDMGGWEKPCGYRMRERQTDDFARQYQGEQHYGPSPDEFDDEQEFWQPKSGIYLPKTYTRSKD